MLIYNEFPHTVQYSFASVLLGFFEAWTAAVFSVDNDFSSLASYGPRGALSKARYQAGEVHCAGRAYYYSTSCATGKQVSQPDKQKNVE